MAEEGHDAVQAAGFGAIARAVLDGAVIARVGVIITSFDGDRPRILHVNEAMAAILGRSEEDLLTAGPFSFAHPEDVPRLRAMLADRKGASALRYEARVSHRDGRWVDVDIASTPILVDGVAASVAFVQDISHRRAAETALRESEARFRKLVEAAPDLVVVLKAGRLVFVNPAFVKAFGFERPEDVLGRSPEDLIDPDEVPVLHARVEAFQSGHHLPPRTYRARRLDGTPLSLEFRMIHIEYDGAPAILGFAHDVTERRAIETHLVRAARLTALGRIAAGVAHELNNPLSYLSLNLEGARRKLRVAPGAPVDTAAIDAMLTDALDGLHRVASIVSELRSFTRADDDSRGPVDLRLAIASALRLSAHETRHRAEVVVEAEQLPPVWGNRARIEQVLVNLILNAAQAMPDRALELNEIRLRASIGDDGTVVVEVSDNGVGIVPELLPHIFEPFVTTKSIGSGTGLGLSICRGIVNTLGGSISVTSRPGEGATFRVVLPSRAAGVDPSPEVLRTAPPTSEIRRRPRVLVIDDEPTLARAIADMLRSRCDVTAVTAADDATDLLKSGSDYDLILCDLLMPKVTGMDFYAGLDDVRPGLRERVVFLTGATLEPRVIAFLESVPNRSVLKPFGERELGELLDDWFARAEAS